MFPAYIIVAQKFKHLNVDHHEEKFVDPLLTDDILTTLTMDNPANNGNRQRGGDFPDPTKEQDKCQEFLTNFISNNNRKYYDQLVSMGNFAWLNQLDPNPPII